VGRENIVDPSWGLPREGVSEWRGLPRATSGGPCEDSSCVLIAVRFQCHFRQAV
jgi:hypothetical protein